MYQHNNYELSGFKLNKMDYRIISHLKTCWKWKSKLSKFLQYLNMVGCFVQNSKSRAPVQKEVLLSHAGISLSNFPSSSTIFSLSECCYGGTYNIQKQLLGGHERLWWSWAEAPCEIPHVAIGILWPRLLVQKPEALIQGLSVLFHFTFLWRNFSLCWLI